MDGKAEVLGKGCERMMEEEKEEGGGITTAWLEKPRNPVPAIFFGPNSEKYSRTRKKGCGQYCCEKMMEEKKEGWVGITTTILQFLSSIQVEPILRALELDEWELLLGLMPQDTLATLKRYSRETQDTPKRHPRDNPKDTVEKTKSTAAWKMPIRKSPSWE